jgi:hypothetical protein
LVPIKKPLPEILFSDSGPTIQLLPSRNIKKFLDPTNPFFNLIINYFLNVKDFVRPFSVQFGLPNNLHSPLFPDFKNDHAKREASTVETTIDNY